MDNFLWALKFLTIDIGVGITGIAGPTGVTKGKPVGLVYIAVASGNDVEVKECRFKGSLITKSLPVSSRCSCSFALRSSIP